MKLTYITLDWTTTSPVSVSAPELGSDAYEQREKAEVDRPIRKDINGRLVIPGTSVAGALRAALPETARDDIMGAQSKPSPLSVLAVQVHGTAVETTRHTAIERQRGAARTSTFHSRQAIAAGQRITLRLQLEHADAAALDTLLDTLRGWQPRLGSGASVGRGRLRVDGMRHRTLDLANDADLAIHLESAGPEGFDATVASGTPLRPDPRASRPLLDIGFAIVDALHIGSGDPAEPGGPNAFLANAAGEPVVPGSSLKGVIRSRAEYLLRSLGGRACPDGRCSDCPSCEVFGYGGGKRGTDDEAVGRRSAVAFRNSGIEGFHPSERIHVSVDRFTGGALDGALFQDSVVDAGSFRVTVDPLHGEAPDYALGLILAALIDLDEGLLGLGGSVTRGYGTVRAVDGPLRDMVLDGRPASTIAVDALAAAVASHPAHETEVA